MSRALITEDYLTDIADAIRAKNGSSDTYTPPQMAAAIAAIPTGGGVDVEALSVTANGTYTAPTGKAYSPVTVNVSGGGGGGGEVLCDIDFTKGNLTIGNVTINSSGAIFDSANDWLVLPFARAGMTIELDVASMNLTSGDHRRFVMATAANGFIYRSSGKWAFYNGTWEESSITDGSFFDDSTVKIYIDSGNKWHIYKNDVIVWEPSIAQDVGNYNYLSSNVAQIITLGSPAGQGPLNTIITGARIY